MLRIEIGQFLGSIYQSTKQSAWKGSVVLGPLQVYILRASSGLQAACAYSECGRTFRRSNYVKWSLIQMRPWPLNLNKPDPT